MCNIRDLSTPTALHRTAAHRSTAPAQDEGGTRWLTVGYYTGRNAITVTPRLLRSTHE